MQVRLEDVEDSQMLNRPEVDLACRQSVAHHCL